LITDTYKRQHKTMTQMREKNEISEEKFNNWLIVKAGEMKELLKERADSFPPKKDAYS
jgi:truncated hemoglobin YjbI